MRIERICRNLGRPIRWVAFPLHPETPDAGRSLAELFAGQPGYIESVMKRLQAAGRELGLTFAPRTHTYNSRKACQLALWARNQGKEWGFHRAAYRAYFEKGANIAQPEVLEVICDEAGLDRQRVPGVLADPAYRSALEDDWQHCRKYGVSAIPTLIRGERRMVGYLPERLDDFLSGD